MRKNKINWRINIYCYLLTQWKWKGPLRNLICLQRTGIYTCFDTVVQGYWQFSFCVNLFVKLLNEIFYKNIFVKGSKTN